MNKPSYLMIPSNDLYISSREKWRKNYIPFAGYLASKYVSGFPVAWGLIMTRYVRMKGIVYPGEFDQFYKMFAYKHPEFMGSRNIRNDGSTYGNSGAYYDYKNNRARGLFGGYGCLFPVPWPTKIPVKEKQLNKFIVQAIISEIYKFKMGYMNAIDKRN